MKLVLPANVGRSPTAVPDTSDVRDDNVYSAGVVAHGATGQMSLFTVPKGQTIPELKGSAITATTNDHQTTYTDLTTNLNKAGEVGSGIGDLSVRAIAVDVEPKYFTDAGAANSSYGAGPRELAEIQAKMSLIFKIGQKEMTKGKLSWYGTAAGIYGDVAISTTLNASTLNAALVRNGTEPRRFKMPLLIHRSDTIECILQVAGSTGLSFTTQSSLGQPTLVWVQLFSTIRGDAR